MGLLSFFNNTSASPVITADGILLKAPVLEDFKAWRDIRWLSKDFLAPWEPEWRDDELLLASFRQRLRRYQELIDSDLAYPFFIFEAKTHKLLGGVTLSNVRRGVSQSATLGYWIGTPHANQGYMTRTLAGLLPFCVENLDLHRLEAACLPSNNASIRLLQRAGFTKEGFAKDYLKIAGRWEDHILWGKLASGTWPKQ